MSFLDAFRRKRPYLTPGFNGGTIFDQYPMIGTPEAEYPGWNGGRQMPRDDQSPSQQPQWTGGGFVSGGPGYRDLPVQQSPSRQDLGTFPTGDSNYDPRRLDQTRSRTTSPFVDRLMQGQRPRVVDPAQAQMLTPEEQQTTGRQRINDRPQFDADYLNELQDKPLGFKGKFGMALQGLATNLGYQPLPTGRQRDIARAQGRLGQDITIENQRLKRQGIQSQMDARETAQQAAEQRISQGEERLTQAQDRMRQQQERDHRTYLQRYYNSRTDFDPEDPAEAEFVADWQKTFGYKPNKNVRGSQFATWSGCDQDGNPTMKIINKGTGTTTTATGPAPVTTDQQLNRKQRAEQFKARQTQQQNQFQQREGRLGQTRPQSGRKLSGTEVTFRANVISQIDDARQTMKEADDVLNNKDASAEDKDRAKRIRERARKDGESAASKLNSMDAGYEAGPGTGGYPYYKEKAGAQAASQSAPSQAAPTTHGFSIKGWLSRNPGKTEADARAFHDNDPKYKAYPIIP